MVGLVERIKIPISSLLNSYFASEEETVDEGHSGRSDKMVRLGGR